MKTPPNNWPISNTNFESQESAGQAPIFIEQVIKNIQDTLYLNLSLSSWNFHTNNQQWLHSI